MNEAPNHRVRRATEDDLEQLDRLLRASCLPAADLKKRFTEFQVIEDADGKIKGAMGIQMIGKQGRLHSEAYFDFGLADRLRPLLWERIRNVSGNYGLVRLWTQETSPFWRQLDFAAPDDATMKKFPAGFGENTAGWFTLKLKEEVETLLNADQEFERYMQEEKERTEKMFEQAQVFKWLAYLIATALIIFVLIAAFYLFRQQNQAQF